MATAVSIGTLYCYILPDCGYRTTDCKLILRKRNIMNSRVYRWIHSRTSVFGVHCDSIMLGRVPLHPVKERHKESMNQRIFIRQERCCMTHFIAGQQSSPSAKIRTCDAPTGC